LRETYPDFAPTLAAEKLAERDGIVSFAGDGPAHPDTVEAAQAQKRGAKRVFQIRDCRPRFGELVQIDGSRTTGSKARPALHIDRVCR
jgi:hypothetical protein